MSALLRFRTYPLIFHFYKGVLLASTLVSILLAALKAPLVSTLTVKIIAMALIFILFQNERLKKHLVFYQNFGISKPMLFTISLVYDMLITLVIYLIYSVWF
ncbi:hypothetical protein [Flagellimonas myxillae]|uniref:hypothetical protein n=1 Tax=Flagellimonas myxillae TaxID=2942214 RepID=UPI00201ED845|nr:hypothetical protein [Muricauda myxillae]MCL6265186.1 hypothetical protein [Muricauda myxillae]